MSGLYYRPDNTTPDPGQSMLAIFGYSLAALALVLVLTRNQSGRTRLLLALVTLILLNAPLLLTRLFSA